MLKLPSLSMRQYFIWSCTSSFAVALLLSSLANAIGQIALIVVLLLYAIATSFRQRPEHQAIILATSLVAWGLSCWSLAAVLLNKDLVYLADGLAYVGIINLIRLERPARYWTVMICSLLICFSSLVLEPGVVGYLLFILYLALASLCLNAAHFYFELSSLRDRKHRLGGQYSLQLLRAAPLGILTALAVFVLFPRVNAIILELPFQVKQRFKTGYNGQIDLSAQGQIERDESIVMHVSSNQAKWLRDNSLDLYLRGSTLDRFTGRRWFKSETATQSYGRYQPLYTLSNRNLSETLDLAVTMNPLRSPAVFLPSGSFLLKEVSSAIDRLLLDPFDGSLRRDNDNPVRYHYIVQVFPIQQQPTISVADIQNRLLTLPKSAKVMPHQLQASQKQSYLEVPPLIAKATYFQTWLKPLTPQPNEPLQSVLAEMRNHFRSNFRASLLNEFSGPDTLENFLSEDRYGHCELFATAAALDLRSLGIPARIVTGYRGGEYNAVAEAVIVRQYQAHAWVEYFIPDSGWHRFDPTPLISPDLSSTVSAEIMQYYHAANYWLNRYLVDFNLRTQKDLIEQVRQQFDQPWQLQRLLAIPWLLGLSGALILGFIALWLWRRRRLNPAHRHRPAYYQLFLQQLPSFGCELRKSSHESWSQFHRRLNQLGLFDPQMLKQLETTLEADLYSRQAGSFGEEGQALVRRLLQDEKQRLHSDQVNDKAN